MFSDSLCETIPSKDILIKIYYSSSSLGDFSKNELLTTTIVFSKEKFFLSIN
jgi:hypothetical protein